MTLWHTVKSLFGGEIDPSIAFDRKRQECYEQRQAWGVSDTEHLRALVHVIGGWVVFCILAVGAGVLYALHFSTLEGLASFLAILLVGTWMTSWMHRLHYAYWEGRAEYLEERDTGG